MKRLIPTVLGLALVATLPLAAAAAGAPPGAPDGFASVAGLGLSGTTGGAAGPTVTVTTAADLAHYAGANTPYTILVSGRIATGNSGPCEAGGTVTEPRTFYPYTLDPAANVPALVTAGAGAGR